MSYEQLPLLGDFKAGKSHIVNYSMIAEYLRCPLRYKYLYIDNPNEKATKFYFRLGAAIHAVLADFLRGKSSIPLDLNVLKAKKGDRWEKGCQPVRLTAPVFLNI